ncbi:glycosyltransferase family 2 protein [Leeuwenhoekiella polynyae]|uniref:Glycosyltransferase involved in cell wall biosynthesis n=1 Tax=Leeuwenhoekiella polynyae TaxID=1550906 RepID=A0A4V1KRK0_9FLAO|nr:glycosyltransferase family A protein [Leeuwenhoekiella polynyae]RXG25182.1 glycosyltransferase involved in cell wall biosynthesis [Leeuwenhoekiella polynyae]
MIELSIIIPYYNTGKYIEQCLVSARQQLGGNIEIIVVDDGSGTESRKRILELNSYYDLLLTQPNLGQSAARNAGVNVAKGEYILVLDSDDFFSGDFCTPGLALLREPGCKLVCSFANRILENKLIDIYQPSGGVFKDFLFYNCAMGTALFKKVDWELIGGYDEHMREGWEDWEFYIRLLKSGGNCEILPKVFLNYRIRSGSTTSKANQQRTKLYQYIFNKHQEDYKNHFEDFLTFILRLIEIEERKYIKSLNSIDYRWGNRLLKYPRQIKKILKCFKRF